MGGNSAKIRYIKLFKCLIILFIKKLNEVSCNNNLYRSPKLGTRTRADGCDAPETKNEAFFPQAAPVACDTQSNSPRRKGGTLRTPEFLRKRTNFGELTPIPPELRPQLNELQGGRRRAKSADLPAVQVPIRIKQLEEKKQ